MLLETVPSNFNENILPSAGDCSIQQIIKDKEDSASISTSSTKIKKQIAGYRQKKHQQFGLFQKTARSEVSDENCTINEAFPKETKHTKLNHIIPILKKKPAVIILKVGTNEYVSGISREILDDLLQFKSTITKTIPNCQVIFSQPTLRVDNEKAALTLHRLNEYFSELNLDVANNSNIKVKIIGLKGRLALNFIHKRGL